MRQKKTKLLIIIFTFVFTLPLATAEIPLPHVPRLSAKAAMALIKNEHPHLFRVMIICYLLRRLAEKGIIYVK